MSLSLTDYYRASIAPGCATLLHMRRGWRPAVVNKYIARAESRNAATPWLAELGLLESLLSEARRGLPLSITLSNHYLRYRLVPPPPLSMSESAVQALMQHCFRETYGDAVDDWQIHANPIPDHGDVLACAVDKALLEGLKAAAAKSGLRLVSVQPYLMAGFNAACRRIDGTPACFVQVEAGRILLGTLRDKSWLGLRAVTATPNWKEELPAHIEREILLAGWAGIAPTLFLHAPQAAHTSTLEETRRWRLSRVPVQHIAGYTPAQDAPYAMALSGVR